ncbi:MAG TPA: PEP-CTERM sorting domain-containing protein [Candidatus Acidoferrales bacterium]|nr:PEP-CTERM sorting domain-containing protein [Candidatus Acidoferrales bacterium]
MSESFPGYSRPRLLWVAPLAVGLLGLFTSKPVSASPVPVAVVACASSPVFCVQGTTTATFITISPTEEEVDVGTFSFSIPGSGDTFLFGGGSIDVFTDGTASGDAAIFDSFVDPTFGSITVSDDLSFTSGSFDLTPGRINVFASGEDFFCGVTCELIFSPPTDLGSIAALQVSQITPEPSSLLLLGTGLLGLLPAIRRFTKV